MRSFVWVFMLAASFFYSCKKKKDAPAPAKINTDTVSTSTSSPFVGYFITNNSVGYTSQMTGNEMVSARFFSQPLSALYGSNDVQVGAISLNGSNLSYKGVGGYVLQIATSSDPGTDTWYVTGDAAGLIPTFSFANKNPFPSCTNMNVLPDTISKSKGCNFTLTNISNMNSGTLRFGSITTFTLTQGSNHIVITPAMLSAAPTGTFGSIDFQLQYGVTVTRSGKNFRFIKETELIKPIIIVP